MSETVQLGEVPTRARAKLTGNGTSVELIREREASISPPVIPDALIRDEVLARADFMRRFPLAERPAGYEVAKRAFDCVAGAALLVAAAPIFLASAAAIRLTSKGPILFKQRRLGRNGEVFSCLKFRTMVTDAEVRLKSDANLRQQFDATYKLKHDPRITPVGRFLRKTSIDELPQLWNVFRGEMTLIGPRPIVPDEIVKYGKSGRTLLTVKPGLGGLWQVCGRSDTSYAERVLLDVLYIERRCFRADLSLLFRTVVAVIQARGSR